MNYRMVFYTLGYIFKTEAILMLLPGIVAVIYGESVMPFVITIILLLAFGFGLSPKKPKNNVIYARDGFMIVALSWVFMSMFGALPFVIDGAIPNFIDAFFETVSGFTTTGSTILSNVEAVPKSLLFWRSFTHWVGGMGVLVFVMAIVPLGDERGMHIMRAEVPGPSVGKLVPKLKTTSRILYGIYFGMTVVLVILLVCGGMPLYDSFIHAFGAAGTGGFSHFNASVGAYNSVYFDYVLGVAMILFGINFNLYYLLLIGNVREVFKDEELRTYLGIILAAVAIIAWNIFPIFNNAAESIRYSFFQVASIITTTGYTTADFNAWPQLSRTILVILSLIGASAGSTGGGLKVGRVLILFKSMFAEVRRMIHPRSVRALKLNGKNLEENTLHGITSFFVIYMILFFLAFLLISIDNFALEDNFTAVVATINNIGPGLGMVGPTGNFSQYSHFSKIILSLCMLFGRLEIFPMLLLFSPSAWKPRKGKRLSA